MIVKEKNERLNYLVNNFLLPNEALRGLDPIVAGGSITFYFLLEKACKEPFHWNLLLKNLKKSDPRSAGRGLISGSYSDIDIWFDMNNEVHYPSDNKYRGLVSDYEKNQASAASSVFGYGSDKLYNSDEGAAPHYKELSLGRCVKSTRWANTFEPPFRRVVVASDDETKMSEVPHQFIKKPVESVESLLSSFDFTNCKVAWRDNHIYYDSDIMQHFNQGVLSLNNGEVYANGTLPSRVFNALRAFKYGKRYGLDFNADLMNNIFKVFFDCKGIDFAAYEEKIEYINSTYGVSLSTVNTFKSMVSTLEGKFEAFLKMRYFKPEYAVYLIDNEAALSGLKKYIEETKANEVAAERKGIVI
jgi:hypothetical protein